MNASWGWYGAASLKSGVVLNDELRAFLDALQARLPFDVTVTSGVRTPYAQASAMAQDYNFAVYSQQDLVRELTASSSRPSVSAMTAVLQAQVNRGRYLSRHMRGDALDFRVSNLTSAQREQLKSTLAAMGGKVLDEGDHIHVERITGSLVSRLAETVTEAPATTVAAAGVGLWFAWGLATLAVAGAAWYFFGRRRR